MWSASTTCRLWDLPEEQDLPDELNEPQHATAAFVITAAALETDAVLDRIGGDATAWHRWHAAREQWPGSGSMDSSGLGTSFSEVDWSDVDPGEVDQGLPIGLPIRRSGVSGIMDQLHFIEADCEADLEADLGRASGFVGDRIGAPGAEVQGAPAGPRTLGWLTAHADPARSNEAHKMETPTTDSVLDMALALVREMSPGCADEPAVTTEQPGFDATQETAQCRPYEAKPLARGHPDPASPITPAATRTSKRARFGPPPPPLSALFTEAPAEGPSELPGRPAGQQTVASPVQAGLDEAESDDIKERLTPGGSAKAWWSSAHCGSCSRCRSSKSEHAEQVEWMTPLISACIDGRVECVQALLQSPKADLDFADVDGHTALHAACAFGYADCVRMLIAAGASLSLPDHEGATALDGAHMAGTDAGEACVSMMVEAGARDASP